MPASEADETRLIEAFSVQEHSDKREANPPRQPDSRTSALSRNPDAKLLSNAARM